MPARFSLTLRALHKFNRWGDFTQYLYSFFKEISTAFSTLNFLS